MLNIYNVIFLNYLTWNERFHLIKNSNEKSNHITATFNIVIVSLVISRIPTELLNRIYFIIHKNISDSSTFINYFSSFGIKVKSKSII